MKRFLSRRNFIQSGALMATACAASGATQSFAQALPETGKPLPIKLGICSYTFRNFTRAQMLGYLKDLRLADLNVKDTKDHLPMDPTLEAQALADYAAAGIELHAAGTIYFPSSGESDIRGKFEYCKRAGIDTIVAGDPTPESLQRIERFVKEYDFKIAIHNHGPEDKYFPSPFDVLKAIENLDPRIGLCIDVGHAARANANLVDAIHATGARLYDMHIKAFCPSAKSSRRSSISSTQTSLTSSTRSTATTRCPASSRALATCAACSPAWATSTTPSASAALRKKIGRIANCYAPWPARA